MKNWLLKIWGIMLIISSLLFNPFTLTQILSPDKHIEASNVAIIVTLEVLLFSSGFICYFNRITWFIKRIESCVTYIAEKDCWWPIIIQAVCLAFILSAKEGALVYRLNAGGDEPSYVLFSFSSLQDILGQHRAFGFPLILKLYNFFSQDYQMWPYFQMFSYFLSILFLYWAFLRFGFDRVLSLVVVSFLIWNSSVYGMFRYILTESLGATFLNFTIGALLFAIGSGTWKSYLALGVSTFTLYQIRPNLAFLPALIPLWAIGLSLVLDGFDPVRIRRVFFRFSALTLVPLLLFCLLRLIVVGQFGVVSITGGMLSGHATHFLNENNIEYLTGDSRKIAEEVLKRKRQLSFPCNLSPFHERVIPTESRYVTEGKCFGPDLMTAWLVAIKYKTGQEPFDDPSKNIEAWKHIQTLAGFYTEFYNLEVERLLMKFSKDILRIEWKQYLCWIVGGSFHGIKNYLSYVLRKAWIWCIFLFFMGVVMTPYLFRTGHLEKVQLDRWNREVLLITMIGVSLFAVGFLPVIIFNYPFSRLLDALSLYLIPALTLWVLPPVWLKDNRGATECSHRR